MIIQTERLIIDEISLDDANFFVRLVNSRNWLRYIGDRNIASVDDARQFLGVFGCIVQTGQEAANAGMLLTLILYITTALSSMRNIAWRCGTVRASSIQTTTNYRKRLASWNRRSSQKHGIRIEHLLIVGVTSTSCSASVKSSHCCRRFTSYSVSTSATLKYSLVHTAEEAANTVRRSSQPQTLWSRSTFYIQAPFLVSSSRWFMISKKLEHET